MPVNSLSFPECPHLSPEFCCSVITCGVYKLCVCNVSVSESWSLVSVPTTIKPVTSWDNLRKSVLNDFDSSFPILYLFWDFLVFDIAFDSEFFALLFCTAAKSFWSPGCRPISVIKDFLIQNLGLGPLGVSWQVNIPRTDWPVKIYLRVQQQLIQEVTKDPSRTFMSVVMNLSLSVVLCIGSIMSYSLSLFRYS